MLPNSSSQVALSVEANINDSVLGSAFRSSDIIAAALRPLYSTLTEFLPMIQPTGKVR